MGGGGWLLIIIKWTWGFFLQSDIETTSHFLHCPFSHIERSTLLNNIKEIDSTVLKKSASVVTRILLHGDGSFREEVNLLILNAATDFVWSANKFDKTIDFI